MAHNGGTTQLNFWLPGSDTSYPFLNVLKSTTGWFNTLSVLPTVNLNDQGYPTADANFGNVGCNVQIPSQAERPGNYVLVWNGNHGVAFDTSSTVSGSPTSGRWVVTPASGTNSYGFSPTTYDPMVTPSTDMYICHVDDEAALLSGEIFQTKFINKLLEAPIGVLRYMDMQNTNQSPVSKWAYRKPTTYVNWEGGQFIPSIYTGATTNVGQAYSATLSGFVLTDKATIHVNYNFSAADANCTLNVNSTGVKPILYVTGDALFSTTLPTVNQVTTLIYNAQLGSWGQFRGGASGSSFIDNGWPPEIMLALCNKINSHAWLCIPFLAADTPSDYALNLATYFRDNLNSGLRGIYEPCNEVWNTASGFNSTYYSTNMANYWFGVSNGWDQWYGKVLSQLGQTIFSVYSGDRTKFDVVAGQWTLNGPVGNNSPTAPTGAYERLYSSSYVAIGGKPAYPYVTAIAPAHYWGVVKGNGSSATPYYSTTQELSAAYAYSLSSSQTIPNDFMLNAPAMSLAEASPDVVFNRWFSYACQFNLKMYAYEGGYSPDYATNNYLGGITNITKAAQAVVTISANETVGPVGMTANLVGVSGMTQVNGNTYTIVAVNGQQMTINVDSTAFSTYTTGGAAIYPNSQTIVTAFSKATKFAPAMGTFTQKIYTSFVKRGGQFPSQYMFTGPDTPFSVLDPDIYATNAPAWDAIVNFAHSGPSTLYGRLR